MNWRALLCAFTFHTWTFVGVRGPYALHLCEFCKRDRWRLL